MSAFLQYPVLYCLVGIALAGFFDSVRSNPWVGMLVLGGLIFIYGFLARGQKGTKRLEVGDNCYFIGFVYTLSVITFTVALDSELLLSGADTAANLRPNPEGDQKQGFGLERLLHSIGIALGTSIVGMLGRFMLIHGIEIPKDAFQRKVEEIGRSANRLESAVERITAGAQKTETALNNTAEAMEQYAIKISRDVQLTEERMTEVAEKMLAEFGKQAADALQNTNFEESQKALKKTLEEHRRAAKAAGELIEQSAAALSGAVGKTREDAKSAGEALEELNTIAAAMPEKISNLVSASLEKLRRAMDGSKWRAIGDNADNLNSQVKRMGETLAELAMRQKSLIENTEGDVARLREMRASFDKLLKELREDSESAQKIGREYVRELAATLQTAREETNRLYERMTKAADALANRLDNK